MPGELFRRQMLVYKEQATACQQLRTNKRKAEALSHKPFTGSLGLFTAACLQTHGLHDLNTHVLIEKFPSLILVNNNEPEPNDKCCP